MEDSQAVEELSFARAMEELEDIVARLEGEGIELDTLSEEVERASAIVRHCRAKIHATELTVRRVLDELGGEEL